jgi:NAD(P)-dependent dehydrogenase (short-subunit alcohol dehydrogenase family)
MAQRWTEDQIEDLSGRVAIVSGANRGLGREIARALAQKGALVIMACRDISRGKAAAEKIEALHPLGKVVVMPLDLADLVSVREFAASFLAGYDRLDMLINNAGVILVPYGQTAQGFEAHFGINHLGHFALTGLLLERLNETPGARIVTMSSQMHLFGAIQFDDLNSEHNYSPWRAYAGSKLANLLFTYELQRRLASAGQGTIAVASHPGWISQDISQYANPIRGAIETSLAHGASMGALPALYAAVAPEVRGAEYYGPGGLFGIRGYPKKVVSMKRSYDENVARQLWAVSEELTGVKYAPEPAA